MTALASGGGCLLPAAVGLGLVALLPGCRAVALPWLLWGEPPTRTVPAEYPYLAGKRVGVLVRADVGVVFEFPHVQWEVADHVTVALENNVRGVKTVDARKLAEYQRREPDWDKEDPPRLGRKFDLDRLIEINLTQYTTRDPESPFIQRAHIAAVVNVYNTEYPDSAPAYSTEVRVVYPPQAGEYGLSDAAIRRGGMEAFAAEVAGKFYERKVRAR